MRKRNAQAWDPWSKKKAAAELHTKVRDRELRDERFIKILPRHGVNLFCLAGRGYRFARLFRQTWGALPLSVRRKLLRNWRERKLLVAAYSGQNVSPPFIELVKNKSNYRRGNSTCAIAQYTHWNSCFSFKAKAMDALPEHVVEYVIAHELAHAVCCIDDAERHAAGAEPDKHGFSRSEWEADELADAWGFSRCDTDPAVYGDGPLPKETCRSAPGRALVKEEC